MDESSRLLDSVVFIAKKAGEIIADIYINDVDFEITDKADASPLTKADLASHRYITQALADLTPNWPVLSEESAALPFSERQTWTYYWLVDPLDGTKEFIHRTGEFTVNIALIFQHQPVLGVIDAPIKKDCYYAARNQGAFKQIEEKPATPIRVKPFTSNKLSLIASRRHGQKSPLGLALDQRYPVERHFIGSAIKFGWVAEGRADVYVRLGPTSEWDTAAGQCIVEEAGGLVLDENLKPLAYNTKDSLVNPHFIAIGDKERLLPVIKNMMEKQNGK